MDYIHPENECRICLESKGKLINVCGCKGSTAFVHYDCIQKWRATFPKSHDKYLICDLCHHPYNIVEPYWTKKRILLWYNATCFSVITVVLPACAIADSWPCLRYQFNGNFFLKRVQPCYFQQLGWILLTSFLAWLHFCMVQHDQCYGFSAWVCFAIIAFLTACLDVTGFFICMLFIVSVFLPCCTCCMVPMDLVPYHKYCDCC